MAGPLTVVAQARAPYRGWQKDGGAAVPYLVQYDGEKLLAEAATASEAIQAGEKAELEGRNAVRIITPGGQSFSVSEYKVIVAGVRVESE